MNSFSETVESESAFEEEPVVCNRLKENQNHLNEAQLFLLQG